MLWEEIHTTYIDQHHTTPQELTSLDFFLFLYESRFMENCILSFYIPSYPNPNRRFGREMRRKARGG